MSENLIQKRQKKSFAEVAEVLETETLSQESLQQYEKDAGIKTGVTLKVKTSVRLGKKSFPEIQHYYGKIAELPGLKVGDTCIVKGRVAEGSRYLSGVTLEIIKK